MAAQTQHSVTLVDINQDILNTAQKRIEASVRRVAKKGFRDDPEAGDEFVQKSLGNVKYETESKQSLETADLVVEAITPNTELAARTAPRQMRVMLNQEIQELMKYSRDMWYPLLK